MRANLQLQLDLKHLHRRRDNDLAKACDGAGESLVEQRDRPILGPQIVPHRVVHRQLERLLGDNAESLNLKTAMVPHLNPRVLAILRYLEAIVQAAQALRPADLDQRVPDTLVLFLLPGQDLHRAGQGMF